MAASRQEEAGAAAEAGGRPVPILVPDENGQLKLDGDALRSVLMRVGVRHLPVVVVAVAGAFRRGKSFLLSLLLRFLERGGTADWQGAPDEPLTGFEWRGGSQRHTVGIHMSQPARVRLPSGEEVAVVLLDTQGTFDNKSTVSESVTVFALSALMSSVQIYNVSTTLGTDALQHLQLFSEFGRVAADADLGAAFQRLLFLVRDWQSPYEKPYGSEGGRAVLSDALDNPPGTMEELRCMRQHLRQCFSDIDCFLLPHPGKQVATSKAFTGCPRDIDAEFLEGVDGLARLLFSPGRLLKKESAGVVLTAADLVTHFTILHAALTNGEMPEPRSLINTMSEANHLASVECCRLQYEEQMRHICDQEEHGMPEDELTRHHGTVQKTVLGDFDSRKTMLGEQGAEYKQKLIDSIKSMWMDLVKTNKVKNEKTDADNSLCCNEALIEACDEHRRVLNDLLGGQAVALGAAQLRQEHSESCNNVLHKFDERTANCIRRGLVADERSRLQKKLNSNFKEIEYVNEQRRVGETGPGTDHAAIELARNEYRAIMEKGQRERPLKGVEFDDLHRKAEAAARSIFDKNRDHSHKGAMRSLKSFNIMITDERGNMSKNVLLCLAATTGAAALGAVVMPASMAIGGVKFLLNGFDVKGFKEPVAGGFKFYGDSKAAVSDLLHSFF